MRRGTDSLGTDVPSEREINRLAARNEEEFWLFEKMDEERRQRERYKSRLMEEFEVPDWVYFKNIEGKTKGSADEDSNQALGKRRRREVVYADLLTDLQWMKAVENGEDVSIFSSKGRRRDHLSDIYEPTTSDEMFAQTLSEQRNASRPMASDDVSDDMSSRAPGKYRSLFQAPGKEEQDGDGEGGGDWYGNIVTWRNHKRKRSSHGMSTSSSEAKGNHGF